MVNHVSINSSEWSVILNRANFIFAYHYFFYLKPSHYGYVDHRLHSTQSKSQWAFQSLHCTHTEFIHFSFQLQLDDQQNVYNVTGSIQNGATILEFTRKRETKDEKDLSFTEDHCLYLIFPISGGRFNAVNKKMSKHEQTPIVTESRVCIKSCGLELLSEADAPIKKAPTQLAYAVSVRLMNLAESFESPAKGTPEFDSLASQIANSMAGVLSQIPGYTETDVNSFQKYVPFRV